MATTIDKPVMYAGAAKAERKTPADYVWAVARISLGWVFLWAFLDKTFGWGFATPAAKAWINGGSPTTGFLKGTGENALGGFFSALAGQVWVDWLFMAGLAGVGLALVLGIGTRIAAGAGTAMLLLMWAAELPLTTNPFMDEHIIYAIVIVGLALAGAGTTLGLGNLPVVRRTPWLR
ncbi:DoxX family membrane protein [Nonomuraea wenchangensis]|uniref:Thiosulfate dehydrogenase [quinone] large subunit n=1 Tax=Nonomuraea wenchangensis TaxID=568860 RepID=A0A1I0L6T9_9ACTN|nr:DoxX family membrane protein [Nonomuraea wenchangensis]SEU34822.1 thiosulfate dehydrogenase [quinone] large subunit [Nonomuraea wenchangensis]